MLYSMCLTSERPSRKYLYYIEKSLSSFYKLILYNSIIFSQLLLVEMVSIHKEHSFYLTMWQTHICLFIFSGLASHTGGDFIHEYMACVRG